MIFLVDDFDILVFDSEIDASNWLCTPDAFDPDLVAYDSEGRLLRAELLDGQPPYGRYRFVPIEPANPSLLLAILRSNRNVELGSKPWRRKHRAEAESELLERVHLLMAELAER